MSTVLRDLDPATGECIAEIPVTTPAELAEAVARAREAWPAWADLGVEERCRRLAGMADGLRARGEELARTVSREMGKPFAQSRREAVGWADSLPRELEEIARALAPETVRTERSETTLLRDPLGVVAAITPWNFPVGLPFSILVPALAAGNVVVFKPSEHVPLTGAIVAEVLQAVLPPGVLELVQGDGAVGAALVDADVDAKNPRTAGRHLPAGLVTRPEVVALVIGSSLVFLGGAWLLNGLAFALAAPTLAVLLGYSHTKRFTAGSHFVLGLALGLSPLGVWVAARGAPVDASYWIP
ncbi:MAG: aldehyde dehydrogenase family protein, partial [Planctomycetes bacterium]|nr:aldehyde dehydrogenase family protein [Planctomycetota bacterium]